MSQSNKTEFYTVAEKPDFSKEEERIEQYWVDNNTFKAQLEKTKGMPEYSFYDGPPFATGLPHYGHICAGTIKDIVTRYASQTGFHCDRRFGWDCHGLPVEYEIDKKFGIKGKEDYEKMGIANYNQECRNIVMRYSGEWEKTVKRMGRWIDFKRDYKTLDLSFMETVWWVFKQIYDQKLVYRGCKVMPYSTTCNTVLSNFEAGQNYKDVLDPSIFVTFPLVEDKSVAFLAWTTTPWTLPSNLALAVNPTFDYVKIKDLKRNMVFIMAECRLKDFYNKEKDLTKAIQVLDKFKGQTLVGKEYVPLYDYFLSRKEDGCFKVQGGSFVTSDAGTGVVHCAPGFGEEDYKLCLKAKIIRPDNPPIPIDASGRFTSQIKEFEGIYVKDADKLIKKDLKEKNRMVEERQVQHSYPFCYRSETPLIYKAHHSWFIEVTALKSDLIENNKKATWVPLFAQEKRFNNWLENAEDWCFSRNRYWGNPIPLWVSEDFEEIICVGSIQELMDLTGVTNVTDLHRESIDHLTIPSRQGKGVLRRIEEVFDCWFESGSMPYAQVHYPFSIDKETFMKTFPADFIGEGIDQTRGWFYTLNVISTALFNTNPYKNLIVNGLVLAEDGKKMSKRLKNYPDPVLVIDAYGADAIRLYLANSGLVKGETLNFKQEGVKGVVKEVFLPWYNAYRFLIQNISRWEADHQKCFQYNENISEVIAKAKQEANFMDRWIIAACQNLIKFVRQEMKEYRLYTVVSKLLGFLDSLTNWYVRLNRQRLKGELGAQEWNVSLNVLFDVILNSCILMSPYVPFITDMMYNNLSRVIAPTSQLKDSSIHLLQIPQFKEKLIDEKIEQIVTDMQNVIEQSRKLREAREISLKQPIQSLTIIHREQERLNNLKPVIGYIEEELNVAEVLTDYNFESYVAYTTLPNLQVLGKKLGKQLTPDLKKKLSSLTQEEIRSLNQNKSIVISDITFTEEDILVKSQMNTDNLASHLTLGGDDNFCVQLDTRQNEKLVNQGIAREVVNRIQKLRKLTKLLVEDDIYIFYQMNGVKLQKAVSSQIDQIKQVIKKPFLSLSEYQNHIVKIKTQNFEYEGENFVVVIAYAGILFTSALTSQFGDKSDDIKNACIAYYYGDFKQRLQKNNGKLNFKINGESYTVQDGVHFNVNVSNSYNNQSSNDLSQKLDQAIQQIDKLEKNQSQLIQNEILQSLYELRQNLFNELNEDKALNQTSFESKEKDARILELELQNAKLNYRIEHLTRNLNTFIEKQ